MCRARGIRKRRLDIPGQFPRQERLVDDRCAVDASNRIARAMALALDCVRTGRSLKKAISHESILCCAGSHGAGGIAVCLRLLPERALRSGLWPIPATQCAAAAAGGRAATGGLRSTARSRRPPAPVELRAAAVERIWATPAIELRSTAGSGGSRTTAWRLWRPTGASGARRQGRAPDRKNERSCLVQCSSAAVCPVPREIWRARPIWRTAAGRTGRRRPTAGRVRPTAAISALRASGFVRSPEARQFPLRAGCNDGNPYSICALCLSGAMRFAHKHVLA
jgi:hypothetical protein